MTSDIHYQDRIRPLNTSRWETLFTKSDTGLVILCNTIDQNNWSCIEILWRQGVRKTLQKRKITFQNENRVLRNSMFGQLTPCFCVFGFIAFLSPLR